MGVMTIFSRLQRNSLALVSLLVAFTALGYNSWRNEQSEANRTVRAAGFEIIKTLGELERTVFLLHYDPGSSRRSPRDGWVSVGVLRDLSSLMPEPVMQAATDLARQWTEQWQALDRDETAVKAVEQAIQRLREETLASIRQLE